MATITRTPSSTWKAVIRKRGWPTAIKTFRTKRDAQDWARRTEDEMVRGVYIERALLSHLYTVAIREWRIGLTYNPVANVRKPTPAKGRDRRLRADEETRLLAACSQHSNPMLGWMVRLALHSGMRAGEIQSLRRNQVDLTRRVVRLSDTKNGSARTVPLTQSAFAVVREALQHPLRPIDTDLLFWGEPGRDKQRRPYEFHPAWRQALNAAGIVDLRFHDLRHEAVSRLIEAGMGDQEVAAISGHKSMQMLRRYTHLRAEDLVHRLDQLGVH